MNFKKYMKPSYGVAVLVGLLLSGTYWGARAISAMYTVKNKAVGA